jgi:Na+-transporting methylmalonyl-CoA/oxaloacetate decarboxylase gamma subunit
MGCVRTIIGLGFVLAFAGFLLYVMSLAVRGEELAWVDHEARLEKKTFDEYAKNKALRIANKSQPQNRYRKL